MSRRPADKDAQKIAFRLSGADVRRTKALEAFVMRDAPPTFIDELTENQSVLWRAIYREGLASLEERMAQSSDEETARLTAEESARLRQQAKEDDKPGSGKKRRKVSAD